MPTITKALYGPYLCLMAWRHGPVGSCAGRWSCPNRGRYLSTGKGGEVMARTFSYQRQQRNRKQPPLRAFYRTAPPERHQRGPFAGLADQVHERYQQATGKKDRPPGEQQQPEE